MRLDDMTGPEAGRAAPLLAVPIGSCEQHGPHLPLATDTIIATALCDRLAQRRPRVVVAPALPVTASGEHAGFPGTLSIGSAVLEQVLVELARSADWARGLVLVNGHGGNRAAVDRAESAVRSEGRRVAAWWPHVPGGDAHAGHTETSLMLAVRPDLVRTEQIAAGDTRPLRDVAAVLMSDGVAAVSDNGVLGDPTAATLSDGIRLLDALTDQLVELVDGILPT